MDGKHVISSAELREKAKLALRVSGPELLGKLTKMWLPVGKSVVIIGGGIQGCETAEFLLKRDRKVTIAESGDRIGMNIPLLQWELLHPWLLKKGAKVFTGVKYQEVNSKGLVVSGKDGHSQTLEADTILVTIPLKPNVALFEALKDRAPEVHQIGDCSQPGLIIDAMAAGFTLGRTV